MKIKSACVLAVGLAALTFPTLNAASPTEDGSRAEHHRGHPAHLHRRPALRAEIARRLELSEDQKAQLKAQRQQTAETLQGIRADASLTPEQKRTKARETIRVARAQARDVLTPEQRAKAERVRRHLRAHGGRPAPRR